MKKMMGQAVAGWGSVGQAEAGWPGKNDITQGEEDKVTAQTIDLSTNMLPDTKSQQS